MFINAIYLQVDVAHDRSVSRRNHWFPLQDYPWPGGQEAGQWNLSTGQQLKVCGPRLVELEDQALGSEITQEEIVHRHLRHEIEQEVFDRYKSEGGMFVSN